MGRKPTNTETLLGRGSWRGTKRVKEEREAARPKRPPRAIPPDQDPKELFDIIKQIPGYDPYWQAENYYFDAETGADAINFFQQKLAHVKGEKTGTAFILENWEKAIIANLFGWKHKETRLRRYRKTLIFVPKKNGKTPLAAGIILHLLFEDGEPGAEIYGAATEYKQASLVFTHAWGMRNQEPYLADRSKVFKGQSKAIELGKPGDIDYGIYRVVSGESDSVEGFNTHGVVVDELHKQKTRELTDNLETSTAARRQPLIIYITTSDFEREGSICNETHDYAEKVRDSKSEIDDVTFLPVIYQAEKEDDWTSPEIWKKANPNLGISVSWEHIERECKRAQQTPTYENTFKRLHLNIRTEQAIRWLPIDLWDKCASPVEEGGLVGRFCYAGLDMSSVQDVTAFVAVFPIDEIIYVVPRFWIPKENAIKREERDRVPYLTWARQGFIKMTEGNVVDYDVVHTDIRDFGQKFGLKDIGIDRWNATQIMTQLQGDGFEVVPFGQGYFSMNAPSKELERFILEQRLAHGGHPVLRWMALNVSAEIDPAGSIKPSKKTSKEKIDGIVALVMAIGRMIVQPEPKKSVYETRGVFDPLAEN